MNCRQKIFLQRNRLTRLLEWMSKKQIEKLITKTHLLIAPGYQFKIIKGLITNFHQPQSTLVITGCRVDRRRLEKSISVCPGK